jgi:hypothetical protein
MTTPSTERLFALLPAIYRLRDAQDHQDTLRALLSVIEGERQRLEADVHGLYDNWFIETCDEWVVPYLGDLLSTRGLVPLQNAKFSRRGLVANTLGFRRRKGTAAMLEQLARDVTAWPAKVVEFFQLLGTTQHLNHVRPGKGGTVGLRDTDSLELVDTPFQTAARTAEIRHIDIGRGRYNITNVGLFLWRLDAYDVSRATAHAVATPADGRYTVSPLGHDMPLFNLPQTEVEITQLAGEPNVPGPLRRRPLYDELEAARQALVDGRRPAGTYFGTQPVVRVFVNGSPTPIPPERIEVSNLSDPPTPVATGWRRPPTTRPYLPTAGGLAIPMPIEAAVDPVLGRIAFPVGVTPTRVDVSYVYGFPGDLGGGPYERRLTLATPATGTWARTVSRLDPGADFSTLGTALAAWANPGLGNKANAIITILDSATYGEALAIEPAENHGLVIQAANGHRPHLRLTGNQGALGRLAVTGATGSTASLTLNGLLVEGSLDVAANSLGRLSIVHCTLVPGRSVDAQGQPSEPEQPSVVVGALDTGLTLSIDHAVIGPVRLPSAAAGLVVQDSIVDAPARAGRAHVVPGLVSGVLSSVNLTSAAPAVAVTIGDEGPYRAAFPANQPLPTTVAQARDRLQAAIQAANASPAFSHARVITVPGVNRLIVLPGVAAAVTVAAAADDSSTVTQLRLDRPSGARPVHATIGGPLASFTGLTAAAPSLGVTMGAEGPRTITLSANPSTVVQARNVLQDALRNAAPDATDAFTAALVGNVDDRLVVLPGAEAVPALFATTLTDLTTLRELALESGRPAVAASAAGEQPGPPATLERATILGAVHVKELTLASEVIFTDVVTADRRQAGCVRFSAVPAGSRTPRRFRCQPDLAALSAVDAARRLDPSLDAAAQERIERDVQLRLTPSFTSVRYGQPAYGQLGPACAEEIRTGAEDENEMGAFNFLQQGHRLKNLRSSLDEYLRFGLEAGVFFVT